MEKLRIHKSNIKTYTYYINTLNIYLDFFIETVKDINDETNHTSSSKNVLTNLVSKIHRDIENFCEVYDDNNEVYAICKNEELQVKDKIHSLISRYKFLIEFTHNEILREI